MNTFEEQILKIITKNHGEEIAFEEDAIKTSQEIVFLFEKFILWKDSPKCPFNTSYNGIEKNRVEIEYFKDNKVYTLDQVFDYYLNHKP
jgi:hypothetical protein